MIRKIFLSLIFFFTLISCTDDSDTEFLNFVNNKISQQRIQIPNSILIGDSKVGCLRRTDGFKNLDIRIGKNKSGINTSGLIQLLNNQQIDTTIQNVFISIGTNDGYKGNPSENLKSKIKTVFPRVSKMWVIWGSRGWGNIKNTTIQQQELFYKQFVKNGFGEIKTTAGYFTTDELAHTCNQKYHKEIIEQIHKILN